MKVSDLKAIYPSGDDLCRQLAESGEPVLLAFSRGKDSIGVWLKLREHGVNVHPFHRVTIPGLDWTERDLQYYEEVFEQHIIRLLNPKFYGWLTQGVWQNPLTAAYGYAMDLPKVSDVQQAQYLTECLRLPDDTLVALGLRAADSIQRRLHINKSGPLARYPDRNGRVYPVWDWNRSELFGAIERSGVRLPRVDYTVWGRTLDSVSGSALLQLRPWVKELGLAHDWDVIRFWFPEVEGLTQARHELYESYYPEQHRTPSAADNRSYRNA